MGVFEQGWIRRKLRIAFPSYFVNHNYEIIIYPPKNSYFRLDDVEVEVILKCKILEYLSREASKSISKKSQKYHLDGINNYLGTNFTQEDMDKIYTHLGNGCNRTKCLEFIDRDYNLDFLDTINICQNEVIIYD